MKIKLAITKEKAMHVFGVFLKNSIISSCPHGSEWYTEGSKEMSILFHLLLRMMVMRKGREENTSCEDEHVGSKGDENVNARNRRSQSVFLTQTQA